MFRLAARCSATLAPATLSLAHYSSGEGTKTGDSTSFFSGLAPSFGGGGAAGAPLRQCIGGSLVASTSSKSLEVEDPSTGAIIGRIPEGTAEDAHAALVAARAAQPAWAKRSATERARGLRAMARVITEHRVELAECLASEQNKTLGLAQVEIDFTAEYFDYHAGLARVYEGEIINSDDPNEHIYLHKVPLGVSVGISVERQELFLSEPRLEFTENRSCRLLVGRHLPLELPRLRHGAQARARAPRRLRGTRRRGEHANAKRRNVPPTRAVRTRAKADAPFFRVTLREMVARPKQ